MMNTISILGCGWLGYPLAKRLVLKEFKVFGSTSTQSKLNQLSAAGIVPFYIKVSDHIAGSSIEEFFSSDTLFLNLPFKRAFKNPEEYLIQVKSVIDQLHRSSISHVIFASSTSIYSDAVGIAIKFRFK